MQINADGFRSERVLDQGAVRDGVFESGHSYDGIAYVLITSGSQRVAQIPVPIVGDRLTICHVNTAPGGEARQRLERDVRNLHKRLADIYLRLVAQNARLTRLTEVKNHAEALGEVTRGLDRLDGELAVLTGEFSRLKREVPAGDPALAPELGQCEIFVQEVRKQRDRLLQNQDDLQKAIEGEQKQEPERNNFLALLRKAENQRQDADFEGAIKTYDEILSKFGEREEVRKKKDALEHDWQIKNERHRRARAFVYQTWPNMRTVEDVERDLPKARDALAVCKEVGDRHTPLKLLLTASTPVQIVATAVNEIKTSESDTDKLNLPRLQKLNGELEAFIKQVFAYVRPEEAKAP